MVSAAATPAPNILIATAAVLAVAGGAGVVWMTNRIPTLTDRDSIVIGQFENTTSDPSSTRRW